MLEHSLNHCVGFFQVISKVVAGVESHGFTCQGWIESPLKGAEGNIEFLSCFKRKCRTEAVLSDN